MAPIIEINDRGLKFLESSRPFIRDLSYKVVEPVRESAITQSSTKNYWTIDGVNYRGKVGPVRLSRTLLPAMNLSQMIEHAKRAMKTHKFYTPDAPLIYAITKTVMEQGNNEVRAFLKKSFLGQLLNALSVVRHQPEGNKDQVVHNPGLQTQYSSRLNFVSPDELVKGSARARDYIVLLGASSPDEVDEVFGWATGKRSYSWKINRKPIGIDERVVGFYTNLGRFILYSDGNPLDAYASLAVSRPQRSLEGKQ